VYRVAKASNNVNTRTAFLFCMTHIGFQGRKYNLNAHTFGGARHVRVTFVICFA
jgi:hypothetical protein